MAVGLKTNRFFVNWRFTKTKPFVILALSTIAPADPREYERLERHVSTIFFTEATQTLVCHCRGAVVLQSEVKTLATKTIFVSVVEF